MTGLSTLDETVFLAAPLRPRGKRGSLPLVLPLVHGGSARVECRFEVTGPDDAPVMVVAGGISAGRHVLANHEDPTPGWWQGQGVSLADCRVVAIDWIGADGTLDAPIDARDQAVAILSVLDHLGIHRAAGFIGSSYGAMAGMHAVALAPGRWARLLAISAAADSHPFTSAQRTLQRQAIELGERLGDPAAGVSLARKIAMLTYRTPDEFEERFSDPVTVIDGRARISAEAYLDAQGLRHCQRINPVGYRRLSESIDLHAIDPAVIEVPTTFIAVDTDRLIPVDAIRRLADAAPHGRFASLSSPFGHDAFLKEHEAVAAIIQEFLSPQEPAR